MNTPLPSPFIDALLCQLTTEKDFVFLDSSRTTETEDHSLLFCKPVAKLTFAANQEATTFFDAAQHYLNQGYFLAGWLAYEFGYALEKSLAPLLNSLGDMPLAHLGIYQDPIIIAHNSPLQDSRALPFSKPAKRPFPPYQIKNLVPNLSADEYLSTLKRIKSYIEAGDTYQVNYTLKLLFDFTGSPEALYKNLRGNQPVSYGAYLGFDDQRILSFSPELFFRKTGNHCQVRPMKGTMRRGRTLQEDKKFAAALHDDPKNRSENVMIVDLLRNDLGRLSSMGQVKTSSMFTVETYATLHQMTSTITGKTSGETALIELFKALFPCGSVTGAPKIRTMQIIHELEHQTRGVYTGAIGYIAPTGDAVFNVPIRTIVLNSNRGEMGIGSGIVHDSNPEAEWQECLLKGKFLSNPRPDFQLIETILWRQDTGFWLLDLHLARLVSSANYYDYPLSPEALTQQLKEITANSAATALRIRVLLHQDGALDISATPCPRPTLLELPTLAAATAKGTLPKITISPQSTDASWPFLYHKSTIRDLYNSERQQALERGYFEVIFTNEKGEITEGSITNIIIRQGKRLFTPPLDCGLLPGVCREHFLKLHPNLLHEKILSPTELLSADAIYLINSVRGIIEVCL
ncbi:MAG: aminodeoxychorismate synthase component I [Desulfobulbaceae bacterium]|nr:aminodeoxychorismate synthase component I [Desulfobulbaceae bacterium]